MKKLSFYIFALFVFSLFSCDPAVFDNLEACLDNYIRIIYFADGDHNVLEDTDQQYVESVDLYIYEKETGKRVGFPIRYSKEELKTTKAIRFPKDSVYYRVVAIANLHTDDKDRFDNERDYNNASLSAKDKRGVSRLYLGEKEIYSVLLWKANDEIELKAIHTKYSAKINVVGAEDGGTAWLENLQKKDDVKIRLTKLPKTQYLKSPKENEGETIVEVPFKMENGQIKVEFNSLRINKDDMVKVELIHNGKPLEGVSGPNDFVDVVTYINKYNKSLPEKDRIDITKQEYVVPLIFTITLSQNVIVNISLAPWEEVNVTPEI